MNKEVLRDLFDFINQTVDIVRVVEDYVVLEEVSPSYWQGWCPFEHKKRRHPQSRRKWLLRVNESKKLFFCYKCHFKGSALDFVEKIEGVSTIEAADKLLYIYQLDVPEEILKHIPELRKS